MKKNNLKKLILTLIPLSFAFGLSGCPKKQVVKKTTQSIPETAVKISEPVETQELDVHGKDFEESARLEKIYFDFDSIELSEQSRKALALNADYLKKIKEIEIVVQGHCDERGTIGYNLALGQKRAQAVRQYYISLGLDPKKIGTLSLGKEKPECEEPSEECWAKNRKGETQVRALKVAGNDLNPSQETTVEK